MNDQVKFVVDRLNQEPFRKNLNFINFDNLQGNNLLQLLNDIFGEIDTKQKIDVRDEIPEQTAIRMLNLLKVLKYKPPEENLNSFRQGLVTGDKLVVHPIMKWCLEKLPELKKRAYLARYLVKIDISPEFMSDQTLADLNAQYEHMIDQFKETHKNYDHLMSTQHTTADLKREIEQMEEEKEQIIKRLERVKKRVSSVNNSNNMLDMSRNYRLEVEREEKIGQQKAELRSEITQLDHKIDRLEKVLKEQQSSYHDLNAETIVQKMEEENRINAYLVNDKYPKELLSYKQKIKDCEAVSSKSIMSQSELSEIKKKLDEVNREVSSLIEKREKNIDLSSDKLMFRQQATIISRKKDQYVENLKDVRSEHAQLEKQLKDKRRNLDDGEMIKGEEFKRYAIKFRSKGNIYKTKRTDIAELQNEYNTLKRTEELLKKQYDSIKDHMNADERATEEGGMSSRNLRDKTDELMSKKELSTRIAKKKAELAPVLKELKQIRQAIDDISGDYEAKKSKYDQINAGFESNRSLLEQEVRGMADEYRVSEARYHYLNTQKLISLTFQKRAQDEVRHYTSKSGADKSFRDHLVKHIDEQDKKSRLLKDKQKSTANVHVDGKKQMKLWRDLLRQMEQKRKHYLGVTTEEVNEAYNAIPADMESKIR